MPPELRKRKAPAVEPATAPPAKKAAATKKKGPVAKAVAKVKEVISPKATKTNGAKSAVATKVAVGDTIDLESFGGEIETNDGVKTTLKKLVDESTAGVVLFTYPKASTPGCTTQVCLFRDSYTALTASGYSIYGLSKDSLKDNTTFKKKHELPYPLLCDPSATLISAIGLKKAPSGTQRGVFVIDKAGKVLAAEPGSPKGTLEVVEKLIGGSVASAPEPAAAEPEKAEVPKVEAEAPATNGVNGTNGEASKEDVEKAEVAADVADTAEKLDSNEEKPVEA